jgi:hypothetical protein
LKIITNNPLVQIEHPILATFIDGSVKDVLIKARDYTHLGAELLNHPLSGSLSLGENPYKSLIIKEKCDSVPIKTEYFSLTLIENALEQLREPPVDFDGYNQDMLADFQVLDLDMVNECIKKQNQE